MTKKQRKMRKRIIISGVLYVLVILLPIEGLWKLGAFIIPYLIIGFDVLKRAGKNIRNGQVFDENFLMTIATLGAFGCGEYPEAVAVMLFYQVGELFQSIAVGKSRKSIADLMDICPESAVVLRDGEEVEVYPDEVLVGEEILIKAGERVPLDGVVLEGSSAMDTSALTGESMPRDISISDGVISGCINMTGVLRVEVTKKYEDSTVARILELVENASDKKSKMEHFITKFARYYTPAVVGAAVALAIIPSLIVGGWMVWFHRALTFLVVSCPCALVISIPLSFFGGIGASSRAGILVKGSNYLEALAETNTVVFDKTGTLTKGKFHVSKMQPEDIMEEELLELAALVEHQSNHPISKSIGAAQKKPLDFSRVTDVKEVAGLGMEALVDGVGVLVGNRRLMEKNNILFDVAEEMGTIVYVAKDGAYCGYLVIADEVKENAKATLQELKHVGVEKSVMLTGDTLQVAERVAKDLGVDAFHAGLLPEDKVEKVEEILAQKNHKQKVVFVGDGINDAPVLSRVDIGIAMGAMGSDAAIEAADIVLMEDDLSKIPQAIGIARKTLRIVKQNIVFALGVKGIVLCLTAFGFAGMWAAVFADVGVSIIAIINARRV